ncbi:MAG TPA: glycoside hydrolase family 127 protein [Candidatus Aminicenantes bacterium]|nr:glycoside hydrolase family 127 protein [Candidatus Aminicenantes bacterium]HRY65258.1 glycoside hydrolase family 127 protein [Candidatus Aminicenantes bacterium]HRZ72274.1 glycoside hydrolase family 127 protein [Candidatus Aminicenantes bacterium]
MRSFVIPAILVGLVLLQARLAAPAVPTQAAVALRPPAAAPNAHYPSNRPPLATSPLVKLPVGAVQPRGWLMAQLELMRDGFTGRLAEISRFLGDDSGWMTLKGKGWEEMPYWLKGYGDLGYLLRDAAMGRETERWLQQAFKSQARDGYFGPADNRGANDLWPNMVMLSALQSYYEASGDRRVLSLMSRYFQYEFHRPVEELLPGSWQKLRGGENLESVYWLYNRTGETFLLDLAKRLFARTADWASPILTPDRDRDWTESSFYHGVNIAMGFRYPAVYFQQSGDRGLLEAVERNYRQVMAAYGRQPGGLFGADENIRPGKADPRQGAETCTMVEFLASFESLLRITGDTVWADRAEDVAFNSLPASMTPDLKGLHYLTAANLISCDSSGEHDFQNGGTLVSFDPWSYRCCQHNVAFGWPYFAESLWLATADNGLAAVIYAPSEVRAKVAEGAEVILTEDTAYPFEDQVRLTVSCDRPATFPLYLRLPGWAGGVRIRINGAAVDGDFKGGGYAVLRRTWRHGDQVRVEFAPAIEVVSWPTLRGAASVRRGPLWFALRIGEEWRKYGGTEEWPALELLPTTPWNYGLVLDESDPASVVRMASRTAPAFQPFTPEGAPVVLRARARRVPAWQAEGRMAGPVPPSPAAGEGPVEEVDLIPLGCARLRISVFPVVRD